MLVGDAHIDIGYLVMVIHFGGLSYQGITDTGALEEPSRTSFNRQPLSAANRSPCVKKSFKVIVY